MTPLERAEDSGWERSLGLREMADPTERRLSKFLWPGAPGAWFFSQCWQGRLLFIGLPAQLCRVLPGGAELSREDCSRAAGQEGRVPRPREFGAQQPVLHILSVEGWSGAGAAVKTQEKEVSSWGDIWSGASP